MINKTILIGRITKDLDLRKTTSGASIIKFTLAVERNYKQNNQPTADFINYVAMNKTAELMNQYLHKGSLVGVEGRIQTGNYENKEGLKIYTTEVIIDRIQFLEGKGIKQENEFKQKRETSEIFSFEDNTSDIQEDDLPF